ncbi:transposable element Tc3 transposase [Trichonephila clavipes]|uniref:Transposable element Tc3 transposase n=1 Tax=Trichonephila clavipes TaxID=2585209 RepID=A0A8X7BCK5_TRICX|nr:transposable element Tc3 transposase [Trichonephila clavipes]
MPYKSPKEAKNSKEVISITEVTDKCTFAVECKDDRPHLRDVILEQHALLFRGAMCAEYLFMDDNARPHRANIVDECLQSENITRMDWPANSPDLNQ